MQQVEMGNAIKNDSWITDPEEREDPETLPDIPGFHVLVRPVSVKNKTKGTRLILLFDDQITMKVGDPKDLDPTFNLGMGSN